eukprot:TRINITY_DN3506_c0_g1_i1.p1 TRINITY_DN3506_c0_g1~~TRINITY_DN3506_c0_g1_i1.p1  ORF type:complete len:423 (+),score=100.66 TRINITY_DN3506_c0_g1_i1:93-1271(+)
MSGRGSYVVQRFCFLLCMVILEAKKGASNVFILSEEPRVELHRSLLDAADVKALRTLAKTVGLGKVGLLTPQTNGGDEVVTLDEGEIRNDSFDDLDDSPPHAAGFAASSRLRVATAAWAGLPLAAAQAPVVTRWYPWPPLSELNRSGLLHLDARRQRRRQRAAVAYLSGQGGADDGFTVFPCLETEDLDDRELKRRQRLCSRAQRHVQQAHDELLRIRDRGLLLHPDKQLDFLKENPALAALPKEDADGIRPVDWRWTADHDAVADSDAAVPRVDGLYALVEAMCRGKAPGLRVFSRSGDALLFGSAAEPAKKKRNKKKKNSSVATEKPDWRLWHAGCSPMKGSRWTAQVFLEEPDPSGAEPEETCVGKDSSKLDSPTCSAKRRGSTDRAVA